MTYIKLQLTFHSKPPTAIPLAAPVPARPTKWPLPMLLANREAPTCGGEILNRSFAGFLAVVKML